MFQVYCTVRGYDSAHDTCSVELQGAGVIDTWIDGVAISQAVDRSYLVFGAAGILAMPDEHRLCEAVFSQIAPPGTPAVVNTTPIRTEQDRTLIQTDAGGNGTVTVTFPSAFSSTPTIRALSDRLCTITVTAVSTTGFTATIAGAPHSSYVFIGWSATGNS